MNTTATVSDVENDNRISIENIGMIKSNNSSANKEMISNSPLRSREDTSNDTMNNTGTVITNTETVMFLNSDSENTIPLSNDDVSIKNKLIDNTIIRREK